MMKSGYDRLKELKQQMLTCTMCGYCKMVCPVFMDDPWDSMSPRGRMSLAYGLITGEVEPDETIAARMFACTQCSDCYRRCPSKAKCPDTVVAARYELIQRGFAGDAQKRLVQNVIETGNIYADPDLQLDERTGTHPVFIGCQHLSRPNSTKKTLKLMERFGIQPAVSPESCCGFPLRIMGFEDEYRRSALKMKKTLKTDGVPVITLCPSCMVQLNKYAGIPSVHILTAINEKLEAIAEKNSSITVTYHDPCDLSRGAQITREPREILIKLGYRIVEMAHNTDQSRCCGGGGGILTWDPALSDRLARERIREAVSTGAEMLVTACATCEQVLKKAAASCADQTGNPAVPVRHILDLIAKAVK